MRNLICVLFCVLTGIFCPDCILHAYDTKSDLERLDNILRKSEDITKERILERSDIYARLSSPYLSKEEQQDSYETLYKLSSSFLFEESISILTQMEQLAESLNLEDKLVDIRIEKAMLYTTGGLFMEAKQMIETEIDSLKLDKKQLIEYYILRQRFSQDYAEYCTNTELKNSLKNSAGYYMGQIILNADKNGMTRDCFIFIDHINNNRIDEAIKLGESIAGKIDRNTHPYAYISYYLASAYELAGDVQNAIHWYAESAVCDIQNAVKDNASLCCLAKILFENNEIERAFTYIKQSLDDALFYNSKIRPWQISQNMPSIEKSYYDLQEKHAKRLKLFMFIILFLLLLIGTALVFVISLHSVKVKSTAELARLNKQLQEAFEQLSEANAAKEEYLGLFLSMCSNYLGKLKKLYSREQMDEELRNFYSTFDNAFIQLYPDFVSRFNSLLKEDARIELKKDEVLNTELRIFALIKLGITQSSHIASLLRYSVNTIYNYRAQIKKAALDEKENFEELVKKL